MKSIYLILITTIIISAIFSAKMKSRQLGLTTVKISTETNKEQTKEKVKEPIMQKVKESVDPSKVSSKIPSKLNEKTEIKLEKKDCARASEKLTTISKKASNQAAEVEVAISECTTANQKLSDAQDKLFPLENAYITDCPDQAAAEPISGAEKRIKPTTDKTTKTNASIKTQDKCKDELKVLRQARREVDKAEKGVKHANEKVERLQKKAEEAQANVDKELAEFTKNCPDTPVPDLARKSQKPIIT